MNLALPPRTTRAAEGLPRRHFTVAEIEAMVRAGIIDEDERVELIQGELVPMSPKGSRHEIFKIALIRHWLKLCPDEVQIAQETTFRLSETPISSQISSSTPVLWALSASPARTCYWSSKSPTPQRATTAGARRSSMRCWGARVLGDRRRQDDDSRVPRAVGGRLYGER